MAASPSVSEAASILGSTSSAHRGNNISRERRAELRRNAYDRERVLVLSAIWRHYRPIAGDPREYIERDWARRIPKVYERMLAASLAGEHIPDSALDLLKAMTVMCRTLAPAANKQLPVDPAVLGLPSDADLSHLSDEELARVLRRPAPGSEKLALPEPRGGSKTQRSGTESGHQHAPRKKSGGKKKNSNVSPDTEPSSDT